MFASPAVFFNAFPFVRYVLPIALNISTVRAKMIDAPRAVEEPSFVNRNVWAELVNGGLK